jgi:hypothetical protein
MPRIISKLSGIVQRAATLAGLVLIAACGQSAGGATAAPTTSNCSVTACTVTYPAKARNNQDSIGGPGIQVLGVDTKLFTIGQGAALMRVGDGSMTLNQGQSQKQAGMVVKVLSLSDTAAVVTFTKA